MNQKVHVKNQLVPRPQERLSVLLGRVGGTLACRGVGNVWSPPRWPLDGRRWMQTWGGLDPDAKDLNYMQRP